MIRIKNERRNPIPSLPPKSQTENTSLAIQLAANTKLTLEFDILNGYGLDVKADSYIGVK